MCGIGNVPLPARTDGASPGFNTALPGPLGAQARAAAWPRVLAALQAGTTPREQAAALMLRIDRFVHAEHPQIPSSHPVEDSVALTAQLAQLARRAQGAADADVVRWAVQACRRQTAAEGCSSLSPRDVLALDPTDGTAMLAQAAIEPAQREALLRAATAPGIRFRGWSDALPAQVAAALPADLPAYLLVDLAVLSIGIEAARPDSTGWQVLMHCRAPAVNQPARRADCEALARALTTRSDSMDSFNLGVAMGSALGWPQAELARLNAEEAALMTLLTSQFDTRAPYACASVDKLRDWMRDKARWGDLAAAQRPVR